MMHPRGGQFVRLHITNPICIPMSYPLFFANGGFGWHPNMEYTNATGSRQRISLLEYFAYLIADRTAFSPILCGGRLFQQFLVDGFIKVEQERLEWQRQNQSVLKADNYIGLHDYLDRQAELQGVARGKTVILASSFVGGDRYYAQSYQDAMAIVTEHGTPDLFVTFTCNPAWPEIKNHLKPGQTASDRPDLVAKVFKLKLDEFMDDIVKKGVLGKVRAYVKVIEFQKRGLPHVHMLLTLEEQYKLRTPEDVDSLVWAELPDPDEYPRLHEIVKKMMIHGPCGAQNPRSPCMQNDKKRCSKHFPKEYCEQTVLEENKIPRYRRSQQSPHFIGRHGDRIDARWVVPYNPFLSSKYNAHINVEVCTSIATVKYLFKYVFKGHDKASVYITENQVIATDQQQAQNNVLHHDEIQNYTDARYVGAPEAAWKLKKYAMQDKSHHIERLAVHLEGEQMVYFRDSEDTQQVLQRAEDSQTTLTAWFALNQRDPNARQYLYKDIPKHYTWDKKDKAWKPRQRGFNVIGRMYTVSPRDAQRYRLRLLLLNVRGATSFENLRTVRTTDEHGITSEVVYATYSEAARALGLLRGDDEWENCMRDAVVHQMPYQLRSLFVIILCECGPGSPSDLYEQFKKDLSDDYIHRTNNEELGIEIAYADIERRLNLLGKSWTSFGRAAPARSFEELTSTVDLIDQDQERQLGEQNYAMLNPEQKSIVDLILSQIDNANANTSHCHFMDGPGGSGKTFVYRTLIHILRGRGLKFAAMAYIGIAAQLLPNGKTIHGHFKLSVGDDVISNVVPRSKEGILLREASLFVIDEASMVSKVILNEMDRKLREIMQNDVPFGGKIMLFGGDFRQVLPVKRYANRDELVNICLKSSELWPLFNQHSLITNMRVRADQVLFKDWLIKLGNGELHEIEDGKVEIPREFISNGDLVAEIFGDAIAEGDYDEVARRAILAPKNERCYKLNEKVLDLFPGEEVKYKSIDEVHEDESTDSTLYNPVMFPTEFLNSVTHSSLPPHELKLKKNCIIMLLRNLNIHQGLCNGTRLQVLHMRPNVLICKIITGDKAGEFAFIPRITVRTDDGILPFRMARHQFPVRLGFAMTINKSQGQTFDHVGIDLEQEVFGHGQMYVAFSRATSSQGVKVSVSPETAALPLIFLRNVVYTEIFGS